MSRAPFMPLFCDAYLGDTMHLSLEEHGAYLKLLMITWRNNGQPLPDDDARLARMLGVTPERWSKRLRPVLVSFFDLSKGSWRQKRLEKQWKHSQNFIEVCRENGRKGGRPKSMENNDSGQAVGSDRLKPIETIPTPTPEEEEDTSSKVVHLPARYAFEGKVIRLNQKDFDGWRTTYHGVADIAACLTPLDDSMALEDPPPKGKEWFFRASTWLAKRHEQIMEDRAKAKALADRPLEERYPNDGVYRSSGKPNGADAYTGPVGPPVASTA